VKLLFDANISHRLADSLSDLYPGSTHVRLLGLRRASDREVWDYARTNDFLIVSKDSDFHQLSFLHGAPPKVVWVQLGNCRTIEIETVLRARYESLARFRNDEQSALMLLGR
jgi:predicted nuclease of predicted toxin-antitoxin system